MQHYLFLNDILAVEHLQALHVFRCFSKTIQISLCYHIAHLFVILLQIYGVCILVCILTLSIFFLFAYHHCFNYDL